MTGATGSLGPTVVARLRASGWNVRAMARRVAAPAAGVVSIEGDVCDKASVERAVEGCDAVVHLAGVAHERGADADGRHDEVTFGGSRVVFDAAHRARCRRVVFASSIAVYGSGGVFDESSPVQPVSAYGRAKAAAERHLAELRAPTGEPLGTSLRIATVYGPTAAGNVTAMFDALARHRFAVVGKGRNRKTLVHQRDVADAVAWAIAHDDAAGEVFDVSDGHPIALADLVAAMCAALERRPPRWSVPQRPLRVALRCLGGAAHLAGKSAPVDPSLVDTLVADVAVPAEKFWRATEARPAVDLATGLAELA